MFNAAYREYGGWTAAVRAAGIKDFTAPFRWDRKAILRGLRSFRPGMGVGEVQARSSRLASAAARHFGSVRTALAIAGRPAIPRAVKWSCEAILGAIRSRARGGDRRLTIRRYADMGGMTTAAIDMFGSWAKAVKAAGFEAPPSRSRAPSRWPKEAILTEIRKRAEAGKPYRSSALQLEFGGIQAAAQREFGGWDEAVRAAGLPPPPRPEKWTKERILATIAARSRDGVSARMSAFRDLSGLLAAADRHFGSFENAVRAAHLKMPARQWKWPPDRIVEGIRRLSRRGLPLYKNVNLYTAARKLFGSAKQAKRAAGVE